LIASVSGSKATMSPKLPDTQPTRVERRLLR
jgi:hypothetical protein